MHILLATPLYPPDVASPAPYIKELATRLSQEHAVTIVAYGHLPEQIPGVTILAISKRRPLPFRLFSYTRALLRTARNADMLYTENGPSVELPVGIMWWLIRCPLVFHIGDKEAHRYAAKHPLRRALEHFVQSRAQAVVTDLPPTKPEILPLELRPDAALAAYEASWQAHIASLNKLFSHVG